MKEKARQEIERLRAEINRHNFLYYVDNAPEISDRAFDDLLRRLIDLEAAHPEFASADSPTSKVGGAPAEGFARMTHAVPMLSIDFVRTPDKLRKFDQDVRKKLGRPPSGYVVEPKIDGVAVTLWYERGSLARGGTRGDGSEGDEITANLAAVRSVPLRLDPLGRGPAPPAVLEVRGEAYMTWASFEKANAALAAEGREPFANPRNSTAGTLKQLDPKVVASRRISFAAHGIGTVDPNPFKTYTEIRGFLGTAGLPPASPAARCADMDGVIEAIPGWERDRPDLPFPSDGIVIKIDDLAEREGVGSAPKYPRWAIAFKFEAESAVTAITDVDFQVGQSGQITPVANLRPVELAGTTVSRASLHNFEMVRRKDIRTGDRVVVEKAGEIIPYVIRSLSEVRAGAEEPLVPPDRCPACSQPLDADDSRTAVSCANQSCPGRLKAQLRHWASRGAMDIEGLGAKIVDLLVDRGMVSSQADLYSLSAPDLEPLDRMGARSAAALAGAIEASKDRSLARLLFALGIQHVGAEAAKNLAGEFGTIEALMSADVGRLESARAIGPVIARSVHDFVRNARNRDLIARLANAGVATGQAVRRKPAGGGPLAGLTVVVTGRIEGRTRESVKALLEGMGARVAGSVSPKTSFVLAGEDPGSKADRARELGVEVLDIAAFRKRYPEA